MVRALRARMPLSHPCARVLRIHQHTDELHFQLSPGGSVIHGVKIYGQAIVMIDTKKQHHFGTAFQDCRSILGRTPNGSRSRQTRLRKHCHRKTFALA